MKSLHWGRSQMPFYNRNGWNPPVIFTLGSSTNGDCMQEKKELDAKTLRELLEYDQNTGVFRWSENNNANKAGNVVGTKKPGGYTVIRVGGKIRYAHRLAWLHVYGVWPAKHLDHINRNPADNRIGNLREVTQSQNSQNKSHQSNNTSGFRGVSWSKALNKWVVRIWGNEKNLYIGAFDLIDCAVAAYATAAAEYHTHNPLAAD